MMKLLQIQMVKAVVVFAAVFAVGSCLSDTDTNIDQHKQPLCYCFLSGHVPSAAVCKPDL